MRKFTILSSFFLSFYISDFVKFANASNSDLSYIEYDEFTKSSPPTLSPSSTESENFESTLLTAKLWENAIFVPTSMVSFCTEGLLNIAGAPAAFWGVANAYKMIDDQNIGGFRIACIAIGGVALTRYTILYVMNQNKYNSYLKGYDETNTWGRFVKNIDDPVSYFKSLGAGLVEKIAGKKEVTV